jgi:hypothetical protein
MRVIERRVLSSIIGGQMEIAIPEDCKDMYARCSEPAYSPTRFVVLHLIERISRAESALAKAEAKLEQSKDEIRLLWTALTNEVGAERTFALSEAGRASPHRNSAMARRRDMIVRGMKIGAVLLLGAIAIANGEASVHWPEHHDAWMWASAIVMIAALKLNAYWQAI